MQIPAYDNYLMYIKTHCILEIDILSNCALWVLISTDGFYNLNNFIFFINLMYLDPILMMQ